MDTYDVLMITVTILAFFVAGFIFGFVVGRVKKVREK